MAKKNKKPEEIDDIDNKKNTGNKLVGIIIAVVIVVIWLAIFAVLIKLDFGGFGSSILRPLLKDVPIINKMLPAVPDSQLAYENDYPYQTLEAAIKRIKELELQNESLTVNDTTDSDLLKELKAEIARLSVFEDNQLAFEARELEFETNVVFAESAPDIEEYKLYYESINPTNAEEIYRQVIEQTQFSDSIKEKADIYRKMKPKAAAAIFETMTGDIDLVSQMLLSMKPTESSLILAEMDSTAAAKITKKMFDMDQGN